MDSRDLIIHNQLVSRKTMYIYRYICMFRVWLIICLFWQCLNFDKKKIIVYVVVLLSATSSNTEVFLLSLWILWSYWHPFSDWVRVQLGLKHQVKILKIFYDRNKQELISRCFHLKHNPYSTMEFTESLLNFFQKFVCHKIKLKAFSLQWPRIHSITKQ